MEGRICTWTFVTAQKIWRKQLQRHYIKQGEILRVEKNHLCVNDHGHKEGRQSFMKSNKDQLKLILQCLHILQRKCFMRHRRGSSRVDPHQHRDRGSCKAHDPDSKQFGTPCKKRNKNRTPRFAISWITFWKFYYVLYDSQLSWNSFWAIFCYFRWLQMLNVQTNNKKKSSHWYLQYTVWWTWDFRKCSFRFLS